MLLLVDDCRSVSNRMLIGLKRKQKKRDAASSFRCNTYSAPPEGESRRREKLLEDWNFLNHGWIQPGAILVLGKVFIDAPVVSAERLLRRRRDQMKRVLNKKMRERQMRCWRGEEEGSTRISCRFLGKRCLFHVSELRIYGRLSASSSPFCRLA